MRRTYFTVLVLTLLAAMAAFGQRTFSTRPAETGRWRQVQAQPQQETTAVQGSWQQVLERIGEFPIYIEQPRLQGLCGEVGGGQPARPVDPATGIAQRAAMRRAGYARRYGYASGGLYRGGQASPIYSSFDPASELAAELRGQIMVRLHDEGRGPEITTRRENAKFFLSSEYSIADESQDEKGVDASFLAWVGLVARRGWYGSYGYYGGGRLSAWDWLFLAASQIQTYQRRHFVEGTLRLRLLDQDGDLVFMSEGRGKLDSLLDKSRVLGPYFSAKTRFPNAHYLAARMVEDAFRERPQPTQLEQLQAEVQNTKAEARELKELARAQRELAGARKVLEKARR